MSMASFGFEIPRRFQQDEDEPNLLVNGGFNEGDSGTFSETFGWTRIAATPASGIGVRHGEFVNEGGQHHYQHIHGSAPTTTSICGYINDTVFPGGKMYNVVVKAKNLGDNLEQLAVDARIGTSRQFVGASIDVDASGVYKDYPAVIDATGIGDFDFLFITVTNQETQLLIDKISMI